MVAIISTHREEEGLTFCPPSSQFPSFPTTSSVVVCADMKWIAHKLLKACCRWVFTFQGFLRDWQWKSTEETKVHSLLKTVSLLLPSYWDSLGIHLGRCMVTLGPMATVVAKTHWRSKPYPTALVRTNTRKHCSGLGPSQGVSHHLHNLYNSDCNFFAPQMTMTYKVQSLFFIHFSVWSILNIERIGPQMGSMGSWQWCELCVPPHGTGTHEGKQGHKSCLEELSCLPDWRGVSLAGVNPRAKKILSAVRLLPGRESFRRQPGWKLAQIQWGWSGSQQETESKPGSQCMSHVQFMHQVLLKTSCFMYA